MSELTAAYRVMQAHCGIEKGDTVRIVRAFKPYELEISMDFSPAMLEDIGKTLVIRQISSSGGYLIGDWWWPWFCLELVEKAKPELPAGVTFTADGLKVGEVYLSKETIRRNLGL